MRFILFFMLTLMVYSCTTNSRTKSLPHTSDKKEANGLMNDDVATEELEDERALEEGEYITEEAQRNLYEFSVELESTDKDQVEPTVAEDPMTDNVTKKEEKAREQAKGKNSEAPPMQVFRVRLKIKNKNTRPIWYLMPYNGATTLPPKGHFKAASGLNSNFNILKARSCQGEEEGTQLIELDYNGQPNQHFRAFYIPAQSTMTLKNYNIDCWQEADKIELWAVEELWVNGLHLLQNWMPLELLSSKDVSIACSRESGCLWQEIEPDPSFQAKPETIQYIQANKISKFMVQLEAGQ